VETRPGSGPETEHRKHRRTGPPRIRVLHTGLEAPRDGCKAERIGGAGDDACDVRATDPAGRVWAIQVKHRRDGDRGPAVGVGVLQQVNGAARQVHGADIAVVLTNGRFSSQAIPWGREHRIHLVDRRVFGEWAAGSRPLWDLLNRIPSPRRPTALS
jgi:restriction system protein